MQEETGIEMSFKASSLQILLFGFQFSLFSVSDCDYPQVTTGDQPAYYFWQRTVKKLRTHMVVDDG